eukprot:scaffold398958_cov19-Prasinocladus_malaysianus.AAC.1
MASYVILSWPLAGGTRSSRRKELLHGELPPALGRMAYDRCYRCNSSRNATRRTLRYICQSATSTAARTRSLWTEAEPAGRSNLLLLLQA